MNSSLLLISVVAILSAFAGVTLTSIHAISRRMVPFGGGVLIGVALFWVLPEIAQVLHWSGAVGFAGVGAALLWIVDRWVYAVCPACSPHHEHASCEMRLHGFAVPLLVASSLHSMLDGWGIAGIGHTLAIGVAFHKIPEGIALGVIARASLRSKWAALLWCLVAEGSTLIGGLLESAMAPRLGLPVLEAILAMAGGSFVFLGWHAIDAEFRKNGPAPAFVPAFTGIAGSSVLRFLVG